MKNRLCVAGLVMLLAAVPACGQEAQGNATNAVNAGQEIGNGEGTGERAAGGAPKENGESQAVVDEGPFDWSALPVASEGDFEWIENADRGGVLIKKYLGSETAFKVPGTLGGQDVIGIAEEAFAEMKELTAVDLREAPLVFVGQKSFYKCSNLKRVALPALATDTMRTNPFLHCSSLSEVIFDEGSELELVDGMIYSETDLILRIPVCTDTNAVVREGTTEIGHGAFYGSNVVNVTIPGSVRTVDRLTFTDCKELESVTLSPNVDYISQGMFQGCSSLKEITIPEGVERINSQAFSECTSLERVSLPSTLTEIGDFAFENCKALVDIPIPESVTGISTNAFNGCDLLSD